MPGRKALPSILDKVVGIEKFPGGFVTHVQRTVNTRIQDGVYCISIGSSMISSDIWHKYHE